MLWNENDRSVGCMLSFPALMVTHPNAEVGCVPAQGVAIINGNHHGGSVLGQNSYRNSCRLFYCVGGGGYSWKFNYFPNWFLISIKVEPMHLMQ